MNDLWGLGEIEHTPESALRAGLAGFEKAQEIVKFGQSREGLDALSYALIVLGEGLGHFDRLSAGSSGRRLFTPEKKMRNMLAHNPIGWVPDSYVWAYPTSNRAGRALQLIVTNLALL